MTDKDQQLLLDLINQLRELVPTLRALGPSATGKGDTVEKASVAFDRSSSRIVAAIGKLASQLDKNTRSKNAEERSLAQFVKEVDRATDAQEKAAREVADFAGEIDAAGNAARQAAEDAAKISSKTAKDIAQDRYRKYQEEQAQLTNYAAMQARDMQAVSHSQASLSGVLERLGGDTAESQRNMLRLGTTLEGLANVTKSVTSTLADLSQNGATSFSQLNGVVDSVTGAISKMGASIPFFGAAMTGLAEGTKFALASMQQMSDNFREAAQVGALTADGMEGLKNASIDSGISQKALLGTIRENSVAFSMLGGTVGNGTVKFSKFVGKLTKDTSVAGMQLRQLGLGADDIGESAAAFVALQGRLGTTRRMTETQLTEGTVRYARELDIISKITGQTRKELQANQQKALDEQRFRAKVEQMRRNGEGKAAEQALNLSAALEKTAPGFAKGFRDIFAAGGAAVTDEARQVLGATDGAIVGIVQQLARGGDIGDALSQLQTSIGKSTDRMNTTAQFADVSSYLGDYAQLLDITKLSAGDLKTAIESAKETQDKQVTSTNELTESVVGAQQQLELASKEAEKFALAMAKNAAPAVVAFTKVLNASTRTINKILGVGEPTTTGAERDEYGRYDYQRMEDEAMGRDPKESGSFWKKLFGDKSAAPSAPASGGTSGAPGAPASGAAPATGGATTTQGLAAAGLKLRPSGGDIQQEGSAVSPKLIALAKQIQSSVPGFSYFSGFNDAHHQEKGREYSQHNKGQALDFVLNKRPSVDEGKEIVSKIKSIGGGDVRDEYNFPSRGATGDHIHVGIPEFAKGGIASGPKSGYKAMLHGTEAVVPLPDGRKIPVNMQQDSSNSNLTKQMDMMSAQLMRLDEMVSLMRRQVGVSDKMLRVSQS